MSGKGKTRLRKKLVKDAERLDILAGAFTNMMNSMKEMSVGFQLLHTSITEAKGSLENKDGKAIQDSAEKLKKSLYLIDKSLHAPIMPNQSLVSKVAHQMIEHSTKPHEKLFDNFTPCMITAKEQNTQIQIEILKEIAQSFDETPDLSAEESELKKTICLKISSSLQLRTVALIANMKAIEIHQSEIPINRKRIYNRIAYIPSEDFLSTFFANNLASLFENFKAQETNTTAILEKHFPKLLPHDKKDLVEIIDTARNDVLQYSDSFFELEESIALLCQSNEHCATHYRQWQIEITEQLLEKLVAHPEVQKNARLRAIAKTEQALMKEIARRPAYKMKSDLYFLNKIDVDYTLEELDALLNETPTATTPETKADAPISQEEIDTLFANLPVSKSRQKDKSTVISEALKIIDDEILSEKKQTPKTTSLPVKQPEVNVTLPETAEPEPEATASIVEDEKHIVSTVVATPSHLKPLFRLPAEEVDTETLDRNNRLARFSQWKKVDPEILPDQRTQDIVRKMQIRALQFETMQYMESQAETPYKAIRGIDKSLAKILRTALVHCNGAIQIKLKDHSEILSLQQEILPFAQALTAFIQHDHQWPALTNNSFFQKIREHGNELRQKQEKRPPPFYYALAIRSEALTYLRFSTNPVMGEDIQQMAIRALRMVNILGDVYAPGFGFDHKSAVNDRHIVAKGAPAENHLTLKL